ncbi:MAG TPA: hypothetical protein PKI46_09150, partial [Bacteroidales bacterium]|nr:hypothetical protein [Bacteroidales bacterium]
MSFKFNPFSSTFDIVGSSSGGSGDVVGPASSLDNQSVLFDGLTGKLIKQGSTTDDGSILAPITDDSLDLGDSTHRFKDLYLSNSVLFDVGTSIEVGTVTTELDYEATAHNFYVDSNIIAKMIMGTDAWLPGTHNAIDLGSDALEW